MIHIEFSSNQYGKSRDIQRCQSWIAPYLRDSPCKGLRFGSPNESLVARVDTVDGQAEFHFHRQRAGRLWRNGAVEDDVAEGAIGTKVVYSAGLLGYVLRRW